MPTWVGPLAAFSASLSWAYATTRYARASRDVGSARVNLVRALVALPVFAVLALAFRGTTLTGFDAPRLSWLLVSVLSSYALADSVFLFAARRVGITTALSIASTYPIWAALLGVVLASEPLGARRFLGMGLAVAGIAWLVRLGATALDVPAHRRDRTGIALSVLTSLLWAVNSFSVKRASSGADLLQVNAVRYAMAVVLLFPQVRFLASRGLERTPRGGWGPVIPAVIADAVLGSTCYVYGLSHTDLAVGATLSSLAPVISAPVAVLLGEERWSTRRFFAVVATVTGVVVLVTAG